MSESSEKKRGGRLWLRGLSALCAWLFVLLLFGQQVAESYSTTINSYLGIETTQVVEVDEEEE